MASDLKPSGLDFGVVIAFVAPGFVALQGASYHMLTVQAWMAAASEKEQSVGLFLFVLLASLSMGLVVSGIRALVLDHLLRFGWLLRGCAVPQLSLDWSKVDDKKLPVLISIRDAHYRHYQFYANTLVAMVFWAFSRASTGRQWALISAILLALLLSARDSFIRYVKAVNQAFGP